MVVFRRRKSVLLTPFSDARCSTRPDFSPAQPWRLFHPPALSLLRQPLHPETRLVPNKAAARTFQLLIPHLRGVAEAALYCAHRATTASSWGLCEQEGHLAAPRSLFQHPATPGTGHRRAVHTPLHARSTCRAFRLRRHVRGPRQ